MNDQGVRIRITSDQKVVAELESVLRDEDLPVLSSGPVESPGRLALDFDTVASVVTMTSTLLFNGAIVPNLLRLVRHDRTRRIIVDGPDKRVEIEYRDGITEDDIRRDLRIIAEL